MKRKKNEPSKRRMKGISKYETLCEDVILEMLMFLDLADVLHFCLINKYHSELFKEATTRWMDHVYGKSCVEEVEEFVGDVRKILVNYVGDSEDKLYIFVGKERSPLFIKLNKIFCAHLNPGKESLIELTFKRRLKGYLAFTPNSEGKYPTYFEKLMKNCQDWGCLTKQKKSSVKDHGFGLVSHDDINLWIIKDEFNIDATSITIHEFVKMLNEKHKDKTVCVTASTNRVHWGITKVKCRKLLYTDNSLRGSSPLDVNIEVYPSPIAFQQFIACRLRYGQSKLFIMLLPSKRYTEINSWF